MSGSSSCGQGYYVHICVNIIQEAALAPPTSQGRVQGELRVRRLPVSLVIADSQTLTGAEQRTFVCFSPSFLRLISNSLGCQVLRSSTFGYIRKLLIHCAW